MIPSDSLLVRACPWRSPLSFVLVCPHHSSAALSVVLFCFLFSGPPLFICYSFSTDSICRSLKWFIVLYLDKYNLITLIWKGNSRKGLRVIGIVSKGKAWRFMSHSPLPSSWGRTTKAETPALQPVHHLSWKLQKVSRTDQLILKLLKRFIVCHKFQKYPMGKSHTFLSWINCTFYF